METEGKKTEIPGMVKVREGVVINKDNEALEAYKKRKQRMNKIDTLENDVSELKEDIGEIKQLLKELLSK